MDFAKIQLELGFPRFEPETPGDYGNVPELNAAFFAPQIEVVRGVVAALGKEALVVLTMYSPLMVLAHMVERDVIKAHFEAEPERVSEGLGKIADGLLAFVEACAVAGVDGFYHSTQGGEPGRFADGGLFERWIKPTDLQLMHGIAARCDFNILHVCDYHRELGEYRSVEPFLEYPGHVVSCPTSIGGRAWSLAELSKAFGRPVMGGLDRLGVIATGTEGEIRAAVRRAVDSAPARTILGGDCTVPADTPWENLRVAIDESHRATGGR